MKFKVVILLVLFQSNLFSQMENMNWYFGFYNGITFNKQIINPLIFDDSKCFSLEGSAAISDNLGNLLFYTNGINVWDKNNKIMPNGSGLLGSYSATQSSLILKDIKYKNIYYIFTLDAQEGKGNGLNYSIVNMKLNNGNGDIIKKNCYLFKDAVEKLTAVRNAKNNGYWIITHHTYLNQFIAFELTEKGLNTNPIISEIGVKKLPGNQTFTYPTGYLKFSNNEKILAATFFNNDIIELYDFDNSTGKLSNNRIVYDLVNTHPEFDDGTGDYNTNRRPYGLEFSPNDKYLYFTVNRGVKQIDLTNLILIYNSYFKYKITSFNFFNNNFGSLLLGNDNRIYINGNMADTLGIIKSPNLETKYPSDIDFIKLKNPTSSLGLPNIIKKHIQPPNGFTFYVDNNIICEGDSTYITAYYYDGNSYNYEWSNGEKSKTICVNKSEYYVVKAKYFSSVLAIDSVYIQVVPKPIAEIISIKTAICKDELLQLNAKIQNGIYHYQWSTGSDSSSTYISSPGKYTLIVTSESGCVDTASINITLASNVTYKIENYGISAFCEGDSAKISILPNNPNCKYNWSNGKTSNEIFIGDTSIYKCLIFDEYGCKDSVFYQSKIYTKPKVKIISLKGNVLQKGYSLNITSNTFGKFVSYLWSTGKKTDNITISKAGKYYLTVSDSNGCKNSDSIEIREAGCYFDATNNLIFNDVCIGNTILDSIYVLSNSASIGKISSLKVLKNPKNFIIKNYNPDVDISRKNFIKIIFDPDQIQNYIDTIEIQFDYPCKDTIYIPIKALSFAIVEISASDTTAKVNSEIQINLIANLICGDKLNDMVNINLAIEKSSFLPFKNQKNVLNIGVINEELNIELGDSLDLISNKASVINSINGIFYLPKLDSTPVIIKKILGNNKEVKYKTKNGSIVVEEFCSKNISRITFNDNFLMVTPNPASEFIEVTLPKGSSINNISFYNYLGNKVTLNNVLEKTDNRYIIDITDIPYGLYFLKIDGFFEKFIKY